MGIDPVKHALTPKVEAQVEMLKRQQDGLKIIVGVHKLDFCKGIPEIVPVAALPRVPWESRAIRCCA